jgi:hypothetical protein
VSGHLGHIIEIERTGLVNKALITPIRERWVVKVKDRPDLDVQGNILDHEYSSSGTLFTVYPPYFTLEVNPMPCLFALFAGFVPRLAALFLWLARPAMWTAAFNGSWLWPLLGVIFLPFTTLFYVILWKPTGLTGWDWMWLFFAVLIDIMHYSSSAYSNRNQIPGYTGA